MRRPRPQVPDPVKLVTIHIGVEEEARPSAPTLRVLLLEDRSDFRNVLREYLLSCSYHVTSVSSGVEGLREIMKGRFDLIICDMMMPRMGGEMFYWAVTRVRPATRERFIFFLPVTRTIRRLSFSFGGSTRGCSSNPSSWRHSTRRSAISFLRWVDRAASDETAFCIIKGTARQMGLEIVD